MEQRQRNGHRLGDIAGVVRMQMIAAVKVRAQLRRMGWITQHRVKIYNAIELAAVQHPGVDCLAHGFAFGSVKLNLRPAEK